jgi:hypothetical protein
MRYTRKCFLFEQGMHPLITSLHGEDVTHTRAKAIAVVAAHNSPFYSIIDGVWRQ